MEEPTPLPGKDSIMTAAELDQFRTLLRKVDSADLELADWQALIDVMRSWFNLDKRPIEA
jgi:hypothetical protein